MARQREKYTLERERKEIVLRLLVHRKRGKIASCSIMMVEERNRRKLKEEYRKQVTKPVTWHVTRRKMYVGRAHCSNQSHARQSRSSRAAITLGIEKCQEGVFEKTKSYVRYQGERAASVENGRVRREFN